MANRADIILETLDRMERKFDQFDEKWEKRVSIVEAQTRANSTWIGKAEAKLAMIAGVVGVVVSIASAYIKDMITKR